MKFQVGSDPELFLLDKKGKIIRAFDVIFGDKNHPTPTAHGSVQWDNVMAEFNTKPASTVEEFISNHRLVIQDLQDVVPMATFSFKPSMRLSSKILDDVRARSAGCSPDYNAWKSSSSERLSINQVAGYTSSNLRVAGGHVHLSFEQADEDPFFENRLKMVKALDVSLGLPSVLYDNTIESMNRKKFYGKAGSFRPQDRIFNSYNGIEYRVLSNFWVGDENLMRYIFNNIQTTVNNLEEISSFAIGNKEEVQKAINTNDLLLADKLLAAVGIDY
jgi:hypothetical protein